jgi:prepilin-type N-terminal cleavage/methylation domain-containing protein
MRWAIGEHGGFTLVELLIVVSVIGVLAAVAIPRLWTARIAAHETSAISSMRTIHAAQESYAATCGRQGYAQSLDDLALALPDGSAFVPASLAANGVVASGYVAAILPAAEAVDVVPGDVTCNGASAPTVTAYVAERHPSGIGVTGNRSFAVDRTGTIYMRLDGAAIVNVDGQSMLK